MSWSLFTGFFIYFFVSVMEFIAWIVYETGNLGMAQWYFRTVGYWGSLILYAIPFIFAILQIGIKGQADFPGNWAIMHLICEGLVWIFFGYIHIFWIDAFDAYVNAQEPTVCECSQPEIPPLPVDANKTSKAAFAAAVQERKELCALECPANKAAGGASAVDEEDEEDENTGEGW